MTEGEPSMSQPLRLESVLNALGDPVRLGIVRQLAREGECSCAALDGGRPKSTMSHHFRVLRQAGLVETRHQGTTHLNSLCRPAIDAAFPGLLAAVLDVPGEPEDRACRKGEAR
jgi:DNA-binding transcriptional ArsR family regulator